MTAEIIEKLQEKATILTQERKKRGKTVPEVSNLYNVRGTAYTGFLLSPGLVGAGLFLWSGSHYLKADL